jgi:hypothetical protein
LFATFFVNFVVFYFSVNGFDEGEVGFFACVGVAFEELEEDVIRV